MNVNDARHTSVAGYVAGCRDLCCRRAARNYEKKRRTRRYLARGPLLIDGTGTRRRLQALMSLGWSGCRLDRELGQQRSYVSRLLASDGPVLRATAAKVTVLYDRLSMQIPPRDMRVVNHARKRGWPPPLAWDDETIDDPTATPHVGGRDSDIDPVVVMRLLEGQRVKATKAEKEAAMEQWVADGGSRRELASWHGWKAERYTAGLRLVKGGAA